VGKGGVGLLRHTNVVFVRRISSLLQYQVTWKGSKYEAYTTEACLRMLTGAGTAEKIIKGI
jgi:phage-related protein